MFYKYKQITTVGPSGTIISHHSTEENKTSTLGIIGDFIYIQTDDLNEQPEQLEFIQIEPTEQELLELKSQQYIKQAKQTARNTIRNKKDLEDDLTDQKILIQFMARGMLAIYSVLTTEQKELLPEPYKTNFPLFNGFINSNKVRLDKEIDQGLKVFKILQDEIEFANIAEDEYLSKIK